MLDQQVKLHGYSERAARETIRLCRDRNVLKEYLNSREKEVVSIMIMLFDQEYATEAYVYNQTRLAREKALEEGHAEGEAKLGALISRLKSLGREEDVLKAATDTAARQALYEEFQMM